MQTETQAEKIFYAAIATEGLPLPQRVLRSGLSRVTTEKLTERFACKPLEEAQNNAIRESLISAILKKYGWDKLPENTKIGNWFWEGTQYNQDGTAPITYKRIAPFTAKQVFAPGSAEYEANIQKLLNELRSDGKRFMLPAGRGFGFYEFSSKKDAESRIREMNESLDVELGVGYPITCQVEFVALEGYMEEIPDRVMQSYLAACELGFKEFQVAFPTIKAADPSGKIGIKVEENVQWNLPKPIDPVLVGLLNGVMFEIDYWE